jgi:hypothetical protein
VVLAATFDMLHSSYLPQDPKHLLPSETRHCQQIHEKFPENCY